MERPSPCDKCKAKPCEGYLNEDGECQFNILAEYIAAGGELTEEMIENLNGEKSELVR